MEKEGEGQDACGAPSSLTRTLASSPGGKTRGRCNWKDGVVRCRRQVLPICELPKHYVAPEIMTYEPLKSGNVWFGENDTKW